MSASSRLLALLSLLQAPRWWTGGELAERLEVSRRTIRRDVDRLRDLGYPVEASLGADGGYRLGAGTALPPLLLDDDEAVAVAVGLRTAATHAVAGIDEASVQALAKLEQLLPARLRGRVAAMGPAVSAMTWVEATVDPAVLTLITGAVGSGERLRFRYRRRSRSTLPRSPAPSPSSSATRQARSRSTSSPGAWDERPEPQRHPQEPDLQRLGPAKGRAGASRLARSSAG